MLIHIDTDKMKNVSYIDGIKACIQTVDWPAVLWVMPTITWVIIMELRDLCFLLLIMCAVNPLLTGSFPYKQSIVRTLLFD